MASDDAPLSATACSHDCLGGACVDGVCQPVQLAASSNKPIAVDAWNVYTVDGASVYRLSKTASAPPFVLASESVAFHDLASDFGALYASAVSSPAIIVSIPKSGGGALRLTARNAPQGDGVRVGNHYAYFVTPGEPESVWAVYKRYPNSEATFVAFGGRPFTADGDDLYYTSWTEGHATLRRRRGIALSDVAVAETPAISAIAVDGAYVYYVEPDVAVRRVSRDSGTPETIVHASDRGILRDAKHLAIAHDRLYWASGGTIFEAPKSGGSPVKFADTSAAVEGGSVVAGLAVDDVSVIWSDTAGIWRRAKD